MSVLKTLTEEEQQMAINYRETAEQILAAIGGEENISSATHCVTRLRLVLKDENEVDTSGLEAIEAVKGTFTASGQFQIILGAKQRRGESGSSQKRKPFATGN